MEQFDKSRVIEAEAEIVESKIPPGPGVIGGMDMTLMIDKHPRWRQTVRLLLKQKPAYIPKFMWHWMLDTMIAQEVNYNADVCSM